MLLTYETRIGVKREIDRVTRRDLPKATKVGRPVRGLLRGSATPWFLTVGHIVPTAHRILPSLDEIENAA